MPGHSYSHSIYFFFNFGIKDNRIIWPTSSSQPGQWSHHHRSQTVGRSKNHRRISPDSSHRTSHHNSCWSARRAMRHRFQLFRKNANAPGLGDRRKEIKRYFGKLLRNLHTHTHSKCSPFNNIFQQNRRFQKTDIFTWAVVGMSKIRILLDLWRCVLWVTTFALNHRPSNWKERHIC